MTHREWLCQCETGAGVVVEDSPPLASSNRLRFCIDHSSGPATTTLPQKPVVHAECTAPNCWEAIETQ